MINNRTLFKNASFSALQTLISGLAAFLLYKYLLSKLNVEQIGLWSVVLAGASIARLSDMGLTGSVVKFVARYHAQQEKLQVAEVIQTAVISVGVLMASIIAIFYPLLKLLISISVPKNLLAQALELLPWSVATFWLGSLSGVFQSSLDGCQKMLSKNMLLIAGNILFLFSAIWLVPLYGLIGLAAGQAAQTLMLMIGMWVVLLRHLQSLPKLPVNFSISKFKEMFGYAFNFQINSLASMLFDPVTKMLMSRFAGLESVAHFEMANQLIFKMRAMFISANQSVVPFVASTVESEPKTIRELYSKTYNTIFIVAISFYTTLIIILPIISNLWFGYIERQFIAFGSILAIGYGLNNIVSPSYFINIGTGELKWNTISHLLMAFLNVLLTYVLGYLYGSFGVAIGSMTALVGASWIVIFKFNNRYNISNTEIIPYIHRPFALVIFFTIFIFWLMFFWPITILSYAQQSVLLLTFYALLMTIVIFNHPYKIIIIDKLKKAI